MNVFNCRIVHSMTDMCTLAASPWRCCNAHAIAADHMRLSQSLHHSIATRWPQLAHSNIKTLVKVFLLRKLESLPRLPIDIAMGQVGVLGNVLQLL